MNRERSRELIRALLFSASLWLMLGTIVFNDENSRGAFLQIFLVTALDLIFLILLFWSLFFSRATHLVKQIQALIFITFKLVCLAILAITLKRLSNASPGCIGFGISYMVAGPLIAGIWVRRFVKRQQR